ncbi:DEDDh family exonuclease [Actinomadura decatromicini]|uniref:DEDDh family exonuclease n=1 Tax=Actinomadura decatromicini TaxID=2604572 RepID=A0A5D3FTP5_9ACTN|nr:DEDDh family exonuclease [Actinomadura decatromicini]TYK50475.1 DEDDh family exonuclease [Actinomadura decatromicini]
MLGYPSDWALVDVETSGFRPSEHRILSIALMTINADGRVTGQFSSLLNPGCDPGPVHVHGLTRERLVGSPSFEQVGPQVAALLQGRVMVAHNARFDYDFLAHEFARAGLHLPVDQRLCTLALNRRLSPPTPNMRLGTLAAHYGVVQTKAHDAVDDTRVLAGVLHGSLTAAARLGLSLPLVPCPPRQTAVRPRRPARAPKIPCAYRNPGRLAAGGPLVQGMKVAITGDTRTPRTDLTAKAAATGLNMMSTVSRHTSALVTNDPDAPTAKAERATAEGIPIIDEPTFLRLLQNVRPGTPHNSPTPTPPAESRAHHFAPPVKGLTGRRVLVLGGAHHHAAATRVRVTELGGSAAVNLSGSVTDVVVLPGGETDRRMSRVHSLGLPVHDENWLRTLSTSPPPGGIRVEPKQPAIPVLPRGGATDLATSHTTPWTVAATWAYQTTCEIDVVAFALDADEQVSCDDDFVFYGAPETPDGTITLSADGPAEQSIIIDAANLSPAVHKVVIAAAIDGTMTFGAVGAIEITIASEAPLAQATLDAGTTERTMLLAEIYRRGPSWRLRAIGQGYDHDLAELARNYGVDITD